MWSNFARGNIFLVQSYDSRALGNRLRVLIRFVVMHDQSSQVHPIQFINGQHRVLGITQHKRYCHHVNT